MKTKPEKIEEIRRACIAVNPSILKLQFGCHILTDKGEARIYEVNDQVVESVEFAIPAKGEYRWACNEPKESIRPNEVIGREIRLSDVLLAISKVININSYEIWLAKMLSTVEIWEVDIDDNKTGSKMIWNLLKDSLEDQEEPTINFIHELIQK